jgi:phosphoribosylglycinamide formyltransferase-1
MGNATKRRLAILASGTGSNAEAIWGRFQGHPAIEVSWVGSNRRDAGVLGRAAEAGIAQGHYSREDWTLGAEGKVGETLRERGIDWLILAGFLLHVPSSILTAFGDRVLNIHPSLLPDFGGAGMYGHHVHAAVYSAYRAGQTRHTGITIHRVNERYDEGPILFQAKLEIAPEDTPASIASRVLALEHRYYPQVIEALVMTELRESQTAQAISDRSTEH